MGAVKKLKTLNSIKKQGDFSESEGKIIEKAYFFAEKAHEKQLMGKAPYFNHPAYAGYLLAKWKQDGKAVSAALLHDVVEDCGIKLPEVKSRFGEKVAFYVDGMSWFRRKIGGVWKKDYNSYFKKFSNYTKQDPTLAIIKASDEMSKLPPKGVRRTIESLKKEGMWERFQKMVNERMRGFWIPFFGKIGFGKVVKRLKKQARLVKEENAEIVLYNYISKKDLKAIKTKLGKITGIALLRN